MRPSTRLASVAAVAVAAVLSGSSWAAQAGQAGAIQASQADAIHAVFVQANDPGGNAIVAFRRNPDGTLTLAATYRTGGNGGRTGGSGSDPLSSQGSLVLDPAAGLLLAVNAGSDSVSVFAVTGDRLQLREVVSSGGPFPVSIAVSGSLAYVLDAGLAGDVHGYRIANGLLVPIPRSTRSLGLNNSNPPFFLSSPAEVGFTPAGTQLVVTTKNGLVDVFSVGPAGRLSGQPAKDPVPGFPFSFAFDPAGRLALVSPALTPASTLGTFTINADGTLTTVGAPVSDGQIAGCWIAAAGGFSYVANTFSGTISQYSIDSSGTVTLVNATAAAGIDGPTDMTTAGGGAFLYNQAGLSSAVDAYSVGPDGSLTLIQSQPVPDGGSQEGIVAT